MGAVVEIWFESLIPFLLKDSHIVQWPINIHIYCRHYDLKHQLQHPMQLLHHLADPLGDLLVLIGHLHARVTSAMFQSTRHIDIDI